MQTALGMLRKEMTCGVPQGSVVGPLLWNIAFNEILKEEVPPGVNDTLVVTAEDDISMLKWKVNTTLEAMTHWIESAGLNLATTKTEAVLFTRRCWFSVPSFCLKGEQIRVCTVLKYLGLWFDEELNLKEHANWTAAEANRVIAKHKLAHVEPRGPKRG